MINITHKSEIMKMLGDGLKLKDLVEQYFLLAVHAHGTLAKAAEAIGSAERTMRCHGVHPRKDPTKTQLQLLDSEREFERLLSRFESPVTVKRGLSEIDIHLVDVRRFIQECPEHFLVLIKNDLENRQGAGDADSER